MERLERHVANGGVGKRGQMAGRSYLGGGFGGGRSRKPAGGSSTLAKHPRRRAPVRIAVSKRCLTAAKMTTTSMMIRQIPITTRRWKPNSS